MINSEATEAAYLYRCRDAGAQLAAYWTATAVALATDRGQYPPPVLPCEAALADFLPEASKPCNGSGRHRAEDFSCVPDTFHSEEGGPQA